MIGALFTAAVLLALALWTVHRAGRLSNASKTCLVVGLSVTGLATAAECAADDDVNAVIAHRQRLQAMVARVDAILPAEPPSGGHMLTADERESVRAAWTSFLKHLRALDAIDRSHRWIDAPPSPDRDGAFAISRAAFLAQYRFALEMVDRIERERAVGILLNEPIPELGLPRNTLQRVRSRFLNVLPAGEFAALETFAGQFSDAVPPELAVPIQEDRRAIWRAGRGRGHWLTLKNTLRIVQRTGAAAWFPVQAGVAEWMGDTKVRRPGLSLISAEQIRNLAPQLRPGDILLERREWYLSNLGLPGFWPHAALYVGTPEERRQFFDDPDVQAWVRAQGQLDGDLETLLASARPAAYAASLEPEHGDRRVILEAMSEGVVFTSLEHSAAADAVAVLRPRLGRVDKAAAVLRAFRYAGRPYDFNFDFRSDAALVCTELIYKAYEPTADFPGLRFALTEVLGRPVLPANEIARQFDREFGRADAQLELVAFLDGQERAGVAIWQTLEEFRLSWRRPKWRGAAGE